VWLPKIGRWHHHIPSSRYLHPLHLQLSQDHSQCWIGKTWCLSVQILCSSECRFLEETRGLDWEHCDGRRYLINSLCIFWIIPWIQLFIFSQHSLKREYLLLGWVAVKIPSKRNVCSQMEEGGRKTTKRKHYEVEGEKKFSEKQARLDDSGGDLISTQVILPIELPAELCCHIFSFLASSRLLVTVGSVNHEWYIDIFITIEDLDRDDREGEVDLVSLRRMMIEFVQLRSTAHSWDRFSSTYHTGDRRLWWQVRIPKCPIMASRDSILSFFQSFEPREDEYRRSDDEEE